MNLAPWVIALILWLPVSFLVAWLVGRYLKRLNRPFDWDKEEQLVRRWMEDAQSAE